MSSSWQTTQENRAVDAYLQYLATGELPPPPNIEARKEVLDTKIVNETRQFVKVQLLQERRDLTAPTVTETDLIEGFVKHAPGFTERNRIAYVTWREMGVPAAVLTRAGLKSGTSGGNKMAPDDPRRQRTYAPRRSWTDDDKRAFVAFVDEHGRDKAAVEYGGTPMANQQRFYKFRSELSLPPPSNKGRPRKASASTT